MCSVTVCGKWSDILKDNTLHINISDNMLIVLEESGKTKSGGKGIDADNYVFVLRSF